MIGGHRCLAGNVTDQGDLAEPVTSRDRLQMLTVARNGELSVGDGVVAVTSITLFDHDGARRHRHRLEFPRDALERRCR